MAEDLDVGTVASVAPHEIPAYEPPAPAVSSHVPDYERVPRAALGPGDPADPRSLFRMPRVVEALIPA